jgi:hypothetical protein
MEQKHFNTKEAVEYLRSLGLNFSPSTLEVWRSLGKGPRYKKVTRKIYYEKSSLDEFSKGEIFETINTTFNHNISNNAPKNFENSKKVIEKKIRESKKPKRFKLRIKSD